MDPSELARLMLEWEISILETRIKNAVLEQGETCVHPIILGERATIIKLLQRTRHKILLRLLPPRPRRALTGRESVSILEKIKSPSYNPLRR